MESITTTIVSEKTTLNENTFNGQPKIIIKKENIGLEEYQHRKYQYHFFNGILKRNQYYDDLCRVKDRLDKSVPNMQQVIHIDMKRIQTNQVYQRILERDLNGPRGLNWQYKRELQRLKSNERDVVHDLVRLNQDLARISISSPLNRAQSSLPHMPPSRAHTARSRFLSTTSSIGQPPRSAKLLPGRSFLMSAGRSSITRLTPSFRKRSSMSRKKIFNGKLPWMQSETSSEIDEALPYLRRHAYAITQEQREVERKLKEFLNQIK